MKNDSAMNEVGLVLDPTFDDKLLPLAKRMPVWIVSSTRNDPAVAAARTELGEEGRITLLLVRTNEAQSDQLSRAILAIDEHHGEASQVIAYDTLWIFGVAPDVMEIDLMRELELSLRSVTPDGFSLTHRAADMGRHV